MPKWLSLRQNGSCYVEMAFVTSKWLSLRQMALVTSNWLSLRRVVFSRIAFSGPGAPKVSHLRHCHRDPEADDRERPRLWCRVPYHVLFYVVRTICSTKIVCQPERCSGLHMYEQVLSAHLNSRAGQYSRSGVQVGGKWTVGEYPVQDA